MENKFNFLEKQLNSIQKKLPKISFILENDKKKILIYPSIRKAKKFLRNKAKSYLRKGFKITIKVNYGYGLNAFGKKTLFQNSGTYKTLDDLKWAFQAFVIDYLKN